MNIEIKDYATAETIANKIKGIAGNMQQTFNELDQIMDQLHGEEWRSNPSDSAKAQYDSFKNTFVKFHDETIRFSDATLEIVDNWKKQNNVANQKLGSAYDGAPRV